MMDFKLEDSTLEEVPKQFEEIVKNILSHNKNLDLIQKDIFVTLIVYIISENGLTPVTYNNTSTVDYEIVNLDQVINWKQPSGVYEIALIMAGFNDINLKLIMLPLCSAILIDIFINNGNCEVYTVCLPMSRYIVLPESTTISKMFHDIKHLSYTLKNRIINPVKSSILSYFGYSSASLIGLPEELFFKILLYLPVIDIMNTGKTCRRFSLLLNNENLWHKLFKRDFKNKKIDTGKDWKSSYRDAYSCIQPSRTSRNLRGTLHDLMDLSDNISYIDNPLWYLWDVIN